MRRTGIYMILAVVAMGSAFWIAEFKPRCGWHQSVRSDVAKRNVYQQMYEAAINGCFHGAAKTARRLIATNELDYEAHLFLGYALRGLNDHEGALQAYADTRLIAERYLGPRGTWVIVDARTGEAAAHIALGNLENAWQVLDEALAIAEQAEAHDASQTTAYQLACLHAQLASLARAQGADAGDATADALHFLKTSMERGYGNLRHIHNDLDLAPIRDEPVFDATIAALQRAVR
jgi:tetratricopeptide (TPR) repeat protein